MQRIGVISDTHLKDNYAKDTRAPRLPDPVYRVFESVDRILHAGDINALWVIDELAKLAPVQAVLGNTDDPKVLLDIPLSRRVTVEDSVIGLTHGHTVREPRVKSIVQASGNTQTAANALSHFQFEEDVNCVVFGHSHFPLLCEYEFAGRKVLLLNPGSATQKRAAPHCGCAIITVEGSDVQGRLIEIL